MFRKEYYKFDPATLSYKRVVLSLGQRIFRFLPHLSVIVIGAIILTWLIGTVFSSPWERKLQRENDFLVLQYEILSEEMDKMKIVLTDMEDRDDNIYRAVFNAEPLPKSKRSAGYGGANLYEKLNGYDNSEIVVNTAKKLESIKKSIVVQSKSYDEIVELSKSKEQFLKHVPAIQPIYNKHLTRIASGYGWRIHPIYKIRKFHQGMDFTAPTGTPIYATGDGIVSKVRKSNIGYGRHILIDHGFGYRSLYAHLNDFTVKQGETVKRGQIIGYVGNSGTSTAPHLHYEVILNEKRVDPKNYFIQDLTPSEYRRMIEISSRVGQSFD